ncbi:hypothetical protein [Methylomonas sp. MgM2]
MTQKTDTQALESTTEAKPGSKAKTTEQNTSTQKPNASTATESNDKAERTSNELSPALIELVSELRETVKQLNPRRHTPKTLRRSLNNVRDILNDIDALNSAE